MKVQLPVSGMSTQEIIHWVREHLINNIKFSEIIIKDPGVAYVILPTGSSDRNGSVSGAKDDKAGQMEPNTASQAVLRKQERVPVAV